MAKPIPDIKFELNQVYKTYSDQLVLAASLSNFLVDNSNLDSAGEQIEGSLRILLDQLLPERVTVSHGHIVDKKGNISYQQDILITEGFYTRSLVKSLDGTEFYPIESIFCSGEVKKTWSQSKLEAAIKSIDRNKNVLTRFKIPSDHLSTGSNFIKLSDNLTINPYRNPLFTFTFSIDFDKTYSEKKIKEIYKNSNQGDLPNISVILKSGIIVCVDELKLAKGELSIKLYPEFCNSAAKCRWVLLRLSPEQNFAYLIFMLTQHINDSILEKVSAMEYAQTMINIPQTAITPL